MVKDTLYRFYISVFDPVTGDPVTTLVDNDFTKLLIKNGASVATTGITVTHVANGEYAVTYTPDTVGEYLIRIQAPSGYAPVYHRREDACGTVDLDDIALEATSQLVLAKVSTLLGGSGNEAVTITVEDDNEDPLADVSVRVLNSDESATIAYGSTDSNGQIVFALDDGSYKVRLRKGYVNFTTPETLTVLGITAQTYSGTPFSPSVPAPGVQTLTGFVYNVDGTPEEGKEVQAIISASQVISNAVIKAIKLTDLTDATGMFELSLIKGAVVKIIVEDHYSKKITVTSDDTRTLADYLA